MEAFAIRKKNTNLFLPGGRRRGFTNDELTDWEKKYPRLFSKKQGASQALRWWLKGICTVSYFGDDGEDWDTTKIESRKPEDMEIVKLRLEVINE